AQQPVVDAIAERQPWADADHLWHTALDGALRSPAFRMVREGSTLSLTDTCRAAGMGNVELTDVIEPNRVLEHYDAGATLVLQGLQHVDTAYARLSTNLALDLDQPVQVNAYLSPADARGLDIHFDYHDVIVVQLAGSKRWRVWTALERTRRPVKDGSVAMPLIGELGDPLVDRVLRAGDCLAVPRGFPHAAETVDDESTHLTLGIMSLTWERLLRRLLSRPTSGTALADRLAVASLDRGFDATEALAALGEMAGGDELRHVVAAEVWRRQPRTRVRPRRAPPIEPADSLRVTPGALLWLRCVGDRVALELGDRRVLMPAEAEAIVAAVLSSEGLFTADDVRGGLDLDSAMVVLRRLTREGVLAIA
ncbi:MAG TPA: cupin domain-containing protein, partial [Ilumatobacteraceae bacterium]